MGTTTLKPLDHVLNLFKDALENFLVIEDGEIVFSALDDVFDAIDISTTSSNRIPAKRFSEIDDDALIYNMEEATSFITIRVPKNIVISKRLHVFYLQQEKEVTQQINIIVEENAEFSYFEYLYNNVGSSINVLSHADVLQNAKLDYVALSALHHKSMLAITRTASVKRYGRALYSIAEVNDATTDANTYMYLEEPHAYGNVRTVAITSDHQEARFRQLVEHKAKDTEGKIDNYGVANNNSILVFEGIGKINKNMKRSIARQSNHGIVLGELSRLDANPLLLIDEYDVEASHGAAIGKMDEEQLYYLMSRGISLQNAQRLIISGFLSPIIEKLSNEELIHDFVTRVEQKTK